MSEFGFYVDVAGVKNLLDADEYKALNLLQHLANDLYAYSGGNCHSFRFQSATYSDSDLPLIPELPATPLSAAVVSERSDALGLKAF